MFEIIAVTNRALCENDFLVQLKKVAEAGVAAVILREKDMPSIQYALLAREAAAICKSAGTAFTPHFFVDTARDLGLRRIHLPLHMLEAQAGLRADFDVIGVSVHSLEQAQRAEELGAAYITAGHVFATDCKKGVEPRGISWLEEFCHNTAIPVYAIGGISAENVRAVRDAGASGACVMSGFMRGEPADIMDRLSEALDG